MKRIKSFKELPKEFLSYYEIEEGDENELTWEEWEDELVHYIKDSTEWNKPKKKGDYYLYSFEKKFGKTKIIAQTKRFIKEIDVICDEEIHGLFIKKTLF